MLVVDVGCCDDCAVGQAALAIHTDVQFHAKVPLLAFAGLVHFGVPRFICILGGAGCANDGGIHNGPGVDLEASGLQFLTHLRKQGLAQFVLVEELAKLRDGRRVRNRLTSQIDTNEAAQTGAVIQGFLTRQVSQVEPVLDEVDTQHALQTDRRAAIAGFGVMRLNDFTQRRPRHDGLHDRQELVSPRRLAIVLKGLIGCHCQGLLFHRRVTFQPLRAWTLIIKSLGQLIEERKQAKRLESLGLVPTRSAIFVGPPGVGKTITARWLASQLGVPFYVLDLTAVMSSLLGRSGGNLRAALDFAKRSPCVLLLDEIDAIAKRRSDDGDVGELKRLVTVILQEVDAWPAHSVLLAATNHPELIDPALWRRFDLELEFSSPSEPEIKAALTQFLAADIKHFNKWLDVLVLAFKGQSFSDIQREINRMRRGLALGLGNAKEQLEELLLKQTLHLEQGQKVELAVMLENSNALAQRAISALTGVSRDTIRKRRNK